MRPVVGHLRFKQEANAFAHLLATGKDHELAEPFQLDRFNTGRLIDEAAGAGIAH